jgi:hypothetical protein
MQLQTFEVQYETQVKKPNQDNGYLTVGTFQAYDERHLWQVMKDQLGYYPPIYHIINDDNRKLKYGTMLNIAQNDAVSDTTDDAQRFTDDKTKINQQ